MLAQNSLADRRIYLMAHFDHPRELTSAAIASLDRYIQAGVAAVNQCPLIRGVNDNPAVLAELWEKLSFAGCQPYYLFQGRPTAGNGPYEVPITHGWSIFQEALQQGSGLARQPRFVMSHALGKIEILAVDTEQIYLRVHRAKDPADLGRLILAPRDDRAGWLDELDWTDWTRPAAQRRDSSVGAVTTSSAVGIVRRQVRRRISARTARDGSLLFSVAGPCRANTSQPPGTVRSKGNVTGGTGHDLTRREPPPIRRGRPVGTTLRGPRSYRTSTA